MRARIAARDCEVWYLPTYAPDLSPIEHAFAKLKGLLRRAAARTRAARERALAAVLAQLTALDAHSYCTHCGYGAQAQ